MDQRQQIVMGLLACGSSLVLSGQSAPAEVGAELPPLLVSAPYTANAEPSAAFASVFSALRYAPEVDLQARGMPEGQSDLSIRGSVFEQTSVVVGAVTWPDPQTGHYTGELPVAPEMLTPARLELGVGNAFVGFNSTVAALRYDWAQIERGGSVMAGIGTDAMSTAGLYAAETWEAARARWGVDLSASWAQGDSPVENGDYRFSRLAARVQRVGADSQTDIFAGTLDKFYGWPGMYIGRAFGRLFPETDDYRTTVVGMNHRQSYGAESWWQAGAAFREVTDDYQFNREAPSNAFSHRTEVWSGGIDGEHRLGSQWSVRHKLQLIRDELARSTSLTHGDAARGNDFTQRDYLKASLASVYRWNEDGGVRWEAMGGLTLDASSEDRSFVGPLLHLQRESVGNDGSLWTLYGNAARSSQVPGYTALRSASQGLFGGNPNLGRETATALEVGSRWEAEGWTLGAALFYRDDEDLVDWTYSLQSPSARQANPVQIETLGAELLMQYTGPMGRATLSYARLEKDADYGAAQVDGSYYALNFAEHRVTLGGEWHLTETIDLRGDLAWREQAENPLRNGDATALHLSLSVWWRPTFLPQTEFAVIGDNLTDDSFEPFPGTPAFGRHLSLRATYRW